MKYDVTDYCVCPACRSDLSVRDAALQCISCGKRYDIVDGIPILLPSYRDETAARYLECYGTIAADDLQCPLEASRKERHESLLNFIGDVSTKKVLDIGSSHALYLRELDAEFKIAFDIASVYLRSIPGSGTLARVCGDAEYLPFKPGFFDVIILSDILEHLLHPEQLVGHLRAMCGPDTRVIVHVPWEEDLGSYKNIGYEFTHLRTFTYFSLAELWRGFYIRRARRTHPSLEEPIIFRLAGNIPRPLYNILVHAYYQTDLSKLEHAWRSKWMEELPRREWWLLLFYKPKFMIFELRILKRCLWAYVFWKLQQAGRRIMGHAYKPSRADTDRIDGGITAGR
jgi:uncharacterized protein YbaR (Trm112 family)